MTFVISPSLQRIVKNHCPKSCNYDCTERCSDDDEFKIKVRVDGETMKYSCAEIPNSFVNCLTYDKKKKSTSWRILQGKLWDLSLACGFSVSFFALSVG
mmetsp:Transcript_39142/g.91197  ORF Transcript_39142/g.91197 Transcript_39142/m.91197 type:complete len:99 (-) Transcript_39142:219-515(-)